MSDNLTDKQLRELVAEVNARDADRITSFLNRFSRDDGIIARSIDEYRTRLGLNRGGAKYGGDIEIDRIEFYQSGAQVFIQMLDEHPIFFGERSLDAGIPIFGDTEDPFFSELSRDVSELLVAGALAIGFLGAHDQRYISELIHIAFSADAISTLLRTVLSSKPIPTIDNISHIPDKLQNLYQHTCVLGVEHALNEFGMAVASNKATSWSTGITMLQPDYGCAGDQVTIQGSGFGQLQPSDVEVWFPTRQGNCTKAQVVPPWADNKIVVVAPANVGDGCVGFVRLPSNPTPLAGPANTLAGEMEQCFGRAAFAAAQKIKTIGNVGLIVPCPPCLANGANHFQGGPPVVDRFSIGGRDDLDVEPGTELTLDWRVRYATNVRVLRISKEGPFIDVSGVLQHSRNIGKFTGTKPAEAIYELTANNGCATITRTVKVRLRKTPALKILGVEVIQAIQRFDLTNPALSNTVRLAANKRTIVRVYIDSGIADGFDNGIGPNVQPNVTGRVTIFPAGAGSGFDHLLILNPGDVVAARPSAELNRKEMSHTVNFELPWRLLSGTVRIEVRVWVKGHENEVGTGWYTYNLNTSLDFIPRRTQTVVMIRVRDDHPSRMLAAPTRAEFFSTLAGARTRLPIAENGFPIAIAPGFEEISTNACAGGFWGSCDLAVQGEWGRLLDHLEWIAGQFRNQGEIWAGLVPQSSAYKSADGKGIIGGMAQLGATGGHPRFLCQRNLPATFTQEMCHTFAPPGTGGAPRGIEHSNCGLPKGETPDPRLPSNGKTEGLGLDVQQGQKGLVSAGIGDVMSYCSGESAWTSIALWDLIFDEL